MTTRDDLRNRAIAAIDAAQADLLALSHDIFGYAEIAFEEVRSSSWNAG